MIEKAGQEYCADLYLRLSKEEEGRDESASIANQRDFLMGFLASHPEIRLHQVRVDDGYSGVDFERPAFSEMMEAARKKEINCIIVKDFSRLGRNFIETGKYIERVFPLLGVRLISVIDGYDSSRPQTPSDRLLIPVKNLINDAYCRDISLKVRSHLEIKRKTGQCVAPFSVYGYVKDPQNKNRLVVDDKAAAVVRDIFKKKLEGYSATAIAGWLNERGILSPMEHKQFAGSLYFSSFKTKATAGWTAEAVLRILENPVYMGILVQGKRSRPNYKVKKPVDLPRENWISVPGSHEAIISKEVFTRVEALLLSDIRTAPGQDRAYFLSGLLFCGDCGRSMIRKNNSGKNRPYIYYICSGHKNKKGCRSSHSIRDTALEQTVAAVLQTYLLIGAAKPPLFLWQENNGIIQQMQIKRQEIVKYRKYQAMMDEDYREGLLSNEEYLAFRKRYQEKLCRAQEALELMEYECEGEKKERPAVTGRELAVMTIRRIDVYEGTRIHIELVLHCGNNGEYSA